MVTKTISSGVAHTVPIDMKKVIKADKHIADLWEDISPLARNEWICWVVTCAKPETRAKHLIVMQDKMHKGMRRPCCWAGCPHR